MSLATAILKYNENIENSMFRAMPVINKRPLSEEQLKQISKFSALGTIPELNLLSELQLTQILKEQGIILPVGVRPSSAEAMVFIQQRLGELSQGREKTLSLVDLINIKAQSGEKIQQKLDIVGSRLKTLNDILEQEQASAVEKGYEEEKAPAMAVEASPKLSADELTKLKRDDLKLYVRDRGLGDGEIPSKVLKKGKDAMLAWIFQQQ